MNTRKLPSREQYNYGLDRFKEGYEKGYTHKEWDMNKLRDKKKLQIYRRFCIYIDYLEDILANNRKR